MAINVPSRDIGLNRYEEHTVSLVAGYRRMCLSRISKSRNRYCGMSPLMRMGCVTLCFMFFADSDAFAKADYHMVILVWPVSTPSSPTIKYSFRQVRLNVDKFGEERSAQVLRGFHATAGLITDWVRIPRLCNCKSCCVRGQYLCIRRTIPPLTKGFRSFRACELYVRGMEARRYLSLNETRQRHASTRQK